MAFTDFSETALPVLRHPTAPPAPVARDKTAAAELSALERRVLALAAGDGLDTLRPPRQRSRLATLLFGPTPPSRTLANARLEALRRLAVEVRHKGWLVPASAIAAAEAAGFSEAQIGRVIDTIGHPRPAGWSAYA